MLKQLQEIIRERETFRFFTSSLLIIYDGADDCRCYTNDIDRESVNTTESHTRSSCANSHPPRSIQQDGNGFHSLQEIRKWVDVRMIDFARSTHHGMTTNQSSYLGPDEGYIHGLATLIGAFESILTSLV